MERRSLGRDLGLSLRMGVALVLLAVLYLPLPTGLVLFVRGWSGSWLIAVGVMAALVVFLGYLPALSERIALAAAGARAVERAEEPAPSARWRSLSAKGARVGVFVLFLLGSAGVFG